MRSSIESVTLLPEICMPMLRIAMTAVFNKRANEEKQALVLIGVGVITRFVQAKVDPKISSLLGRISPGSATTNKTTFSGPRIHTYKRTSLLCIVRFKLIILIYT
jgi:hypothetical protein